MIVAIIVTQLLKKPLTPLFMVVEIPLFPAVSRVLVIMLSGRYRLTNINIPDSVKSIGLKAFEHCESLTAITIPDSVTNIQCEAFSCCFSLWTITYNGTQEQWKNIQLHHRWNDEVPINVVHCTDGDVEI